MNIQDGLNKSQQLNISEIIPSILNILKIRSLSCMDLKDRGLKLEQRSIILNFQLFVFFNISISVRFNIKIL